MTLEGPGGEDRFGSHQYIALLFSWFILSYRIRIFFRGVRWGIFLYGIDGCLWNEHIRDPHDFTDT